MLSLAGNPYPREEQTRTVVRTHRPWNRFTSMMCCHRDVLHMVVRQWLCSTPCALQERCLMVGPTMRVMMSPYTYSAAAWHVNPFDHGLQVAAS